MKVRSLSELNEVLSDDLAWRKRELTTMKFMVEESRTHEASVLARSGVCLLYAHWEGFVKEASTAYLCYVARLGLKYNQLRPSLVALSIRAQFSSAEATSRVIVRTSVTEFLLSSMNEAATVPWRDAVETRSNLNTEVLKEIACLVGLDFNHYATKAKFIDGVLLFSRNSIAHGKRETITVSDYQDIHVQTVDLINVFRDDIENAAVTEGFLKS
jgi:hypothetical protein